MQDKYSKEIEKIFEEFNIININNTEFAPTKKRDSDDNYLGTLPVRLQKLWIMKEKAQNELEEIIQNITDTVKCLKADVKYCDGDLPEWKSNEYSTKLKDTVSLIKPRLKKWNLLDSILNSFLKTFFDNDANMPILGVREGYKVCCRKNNSRNDVYKPIDQIVSAFGLDEFLRTRNEVVYINGESLNFSKLSTKEILSAILKQMK